jgi:hypothetical protein
MMSAPVFKTFLMTMPLIGRYSLTTDFIDLFHDLRNHPFGDFVEVLTEITGYSGSARPDGRGEAPHRMGDFILGVFAPRGQRLPVQVWVTSS